MIPKSTKMPMSRTESDTTNIEKTTSGLVYGQWLKILYRLQSSTAVLREWWTTIHGDTMPNDLHPPVTINSRIQPPYNVLQGPQPQFMQHNVNSYLRVPENATLIHLTYNIATRFESCHNFDNPTFSIHHTFSRYCPKPYYLHKNIYIYVHM